MSSNTSHDIRASTLTLADESPFVRVHFPVQGRQLPADHGYALYSAIARHLPANLHASKSLGIELISGVPWREGIIVLPNRGGSLFLRIPANRYGDVLSLAGKRLDIAGETIRLGIPNAKPLLPAASLYARMVSIKNFTEPEPFLEATKRQVEALGIKTELTLPIDEEGRPRRRILTIQGKRVVGFSLATHMLSDEDSVKLQTIGIGGRRRLGCGLFNPITKIVNREASRS